MENIRVYEAAKELGLSNKDMSISYLTRYDGHYFNARILFDWIGGS